MDQKKLAETLRKIPLFAELDDSDFKVILQMERAFELYAPGDAIVREGDKTTSFFVILQGSAHVYKSGEVVARVNPPDFLGETGFILNEPRIATVQADTQVLTLTFTRENFTALPAKVREAIKDKIIKGLITRLSDVNAKVIELKNSREFNDGLVSQHTRSGCL